MLGRVEETSKGHARAEDLSGLVCNGFQETLRRDLEVSLRSLRGHGLAGGCTRLWTFANVVVNPNEVRTRLRLSTLGTGLPATRKPVGATHVAADVPASCQI